MAYLRCQNCGFLNEVKSEYLVFCTSCNKKISNNFNDWHVRNPEKTFDEYKSLVCTEQTVNYQEFEKAHKKARKKKNILIIVIVSIVVVIFGVIGHFTGKKVGGFAQKIIFNSILFDRQLSKIAEEINKSCPIKIDNETRLDDVSAVPGNTLQSNYTLINMVKDSIDIVSAKENLEQNILNNAKTNPNMKTFRDFKTTLIYNYRDRHGDFVLKITITPEQYAE